MEYPKFKVCARCFTFNHAKYITDTMNGFTMQRTDFPFVCCIVDDASTDGEQDVIMNYVREHFDLSEGSGYYQKETDYAHITYAQHKTNKNCYFAILLLKENHYSQHKSRRPYLTEWTDGVPYEAICEGDDYWIDAYKLQKQFEVMEANPHCSCCTHQTLIVRDGKETDEVFHTLNKTIYKLEDLLGGRRFHTASYLFRATPYIKDFPKVVSGDKALILLFASIGDIYCLHETMAVYRKTTAGMSTTVKFERMKDDLNMLPYLKNINKNFPVIKERSYIYKTIALYPCDISHANKIIYLLAYFIWSFSYFPKNICEIIIKLKRRIS